MTEEPKKPKEYGSKASFEFNVDAIIKGGFEKLEQTLKELYASSQQLKDQEEKDQDEQNRRDS